MSGNPTGNLQLSQGYEVLPPRSGKAYPVPCDEWAFLKEKLSSVSTPPWVLPALSFMLLGAALATLISIFSGSVAPGTAGHGPVVAWAIAATTGLTGAACLALALKQYRIERTQVSEVVKQMELIERRFHGGTV